MSVVWQKSGLEKGDMLKVSDMLLVTHNSDRLEKVCYMSETDTGIVIRFYFNPGVLDKRRASYDMFISWPSIYCGDVRIRKVYNGEELKAVRLGRF